MHLTFLMDDFYNGRILYNGTAQDASSIRGQLSSGVFMGHAHRCTACAPSKGNVRLSDAPGSDLRTDTGRRPAACWNQSAHEDS